jgi:ankyrin repeat protein
LLNNSADVNARDNKGFTPLHQQWELIPYRGSIKITRMLIKHGADINAKDNEGRTALQIALTHGRDDIAMVLTEHATARLDRTSAT